MKRCFLSVCAAALVLSCFTFPARAALPDGCELSRADTLHVTYAQGVPTVQGTYNGKPEKLLVDTTWVYDGISLKEVKDLGLLRHHVIKGLPYAAFGQQIFNTIYVEHMTVGRMKLPPVRLLELPDKPVPFGGIIGSSFLQLFDVEMDPENNTISFFMHNKCGASAVYWPHKTLAIIPVTMDPRKGTEWYPKSWQVVFTGKLDGQEVRVLLDTAAPYSVMLSDGVKRMLTGTEQKKISKRTDDPEESRYPFTRLSFKGVDVMNPDIHIVPGKRGMFDRLADHRPLLILGEDLIRRLHIYIAYRDKRIYITPAKAPDLIPTPENQIQPVRLQDLKDLLERDSPQKPDTVSKSIRAN